MWMSAMRTALSNPKKEIIYNIFDFSDAVAKDIMIPRIDMVSIGLDMGYEEVLNIFKEYMYTRLPVYENDKDNIVVSLISRILSCYPIRNISR